MLSEDPAAHFFICSSAAGEMTVGTLGSLIAPSGELVSLLSFPTLSLEVFSELFIERWSLICD